MKPEDESDVRCHVQVIAGLHSCAVILKYIAQTQLSSDAIMWSLNTHWNTHAALIYYFSDWTKLNLWWILFIPENRSCFFGFFFKYTSSSQATTWASYNLPAHNYLLHNSYQTERTALSLGIRKPLLLFYVNCNRQVVCLCGCAFWWHLMWFQKDFIELAKGMETKSDTLQGGRSSVFLCAQAFFMREVSEFHL